MISPPFARIAHMRSEFSAADRDPQSLAKGFNARFKRVPFQKNGIDTRRDFDAVGFNRDSIDCSLHLVFNSRKFQHVSGVSELNREFHRALRGSRLN